MLCAIISLLCCPVWLFKGKAWRRVREFEENPRTMSLKDLIYFAYKYYHKPPLKPSSDEVYEIFREMPHNVPFQALATVSIGGDLMPYELIKPETTAHLWDEVGPDFFGSDIVFANLETTMDLVRNSSFVPEVMLSDMHFNTDETTFSIFSGSGKYKGYDVLGLANNHSLDMGEEGLENTVKYLRGKGIGAVGARLGPGEKNYVIREAGGIKVGFIAYTYSLNQFIPPADKPWLVNYLPLNTEDCDISPLTQTVKQCRENGAELVICSLHCGNAYQAYPSIQTVNLFKRVFAGCGADVIAGGHPHNLQPWAYHTFTDPMTQKQKQGFMIFSLADFIAYDIFTWCHLCAYLKLEIGRDASGQVVFRAIVNPLVMSREKGQLKLSYAKNTLNGDDLSPERRDLRILCDLCLAPGKRERA